MTAHGTYRLQDAPLHFDAATAAGAAAERASIAATRACDGARSAPAQARGAAGLVPSKTSLQDEILISLAPKEVQDRRIARLKRSVWASGHLHGIAQKGHRPSVCWFVTLTYVGVHDWKPDHISAALMRYRSWCRKTGVVCKYTWVAELQNRGAVHYHLLVWLPVGVQMPHWDRKVHKRPSLWPHGMTNTQIARSGVGYLMKYLSKLGEFHKFPKGLRLYGIGGLSNVARSVRQWFNLPEWVKRSYGVGEVGRRRNSFVVFDSGEILEAAYQVLRVPSGFVLRALRELPERFHDGAYSTFPRRALA